VTPKVQIGQGHKLGDASPSDSNSFEYICPICSVQLTKDSYKIHLMRCSRLNVKCSICNKAIMRGKEEEHNSEFHVQVNCPACKLLVEKYLLEKHANEECLYRTVPCRWCSIPQSLKHLNKHEEICGSKTVECELFGTRVARKSFIRS